MKRFSYPASFAGLENPPVALKKRARTASDVFARLIAAGQRLIGVIYRNEGRGLIADKKNGTFRPPQIMF